MVTGARQREVDQLRALAIISVILLHALPRRALLDYWAVFYIWQAVPAFIVLMGFNAMRSRAPLWSRVLRIGGPALFAWLVALLPGVSFEGPGLYFVVLGLQLVVVLPWVAHLYSAHPRETVALLVLVNILFELAAARIELGTGFWIWYSASPFRYLAFVAAGMWLFDLTSPLRNRILLGGALGGAAVAGAWNLGWAIPLVRPEWGTQNLLTALYACLLVALGLRLLKRSVPLLPLLGRASYHIFLTQMMWFASGTGILWHLLSLPVSVTVGLGFYWGERAVRRVCSPRNLKAATGASAPDAAALASSIGDSS